MKWHAYALKKFIGYKLKKTFSIIVCMSVSDNSSKVCQLLEAYWTIRSRPFYSLIHRFSKATWFPRMTIYICVLVEICHSSQEFFAGMWDFDGFGIAIASSTMILKNFGQLFL